MNTRRFLIGLIVIGLVAAVPAQAVASGAHDGWGDQAQTEKFSKTVPLGKGGTFDLGNISGDIVITGGTGEQVVIDAVKRGNTAADLKAVQIEVTATAARVEVRTKYPQEKRNINASVDYTVSVPRGAAVIVNSVSGDMKVSNIDGALRINTVSGDVDVTAAAQLESAKTVSGDVTVTTAGSAGDITAASVSGDVTIKSAKAKGFDLNSVSGSVTMTDVTCDRVKANSISGDMIFSGPLAKGGRYAFQSHSGGVTITTGGAVGFEVTANSFSGEIKSDYELTVKFGGENAAAGAHGPKRQNVRGTYGDGSAVLELNSFSGDIRIVKK
jgi:DUF4097 and DUF4098 domain-containing protein YvlB